MAKMYLLFIVGLFGSVHCKSLPDERSDAFALATNEVTSPEAQKQVPIALLPIGSTVNSINNFLASPLLQMVLSNQTITQVLADPRVQTVLRNPIVQSVLRNPIIQEIIANPRTKGLAMLQQMISRMYQNIIPIAPEPQDYIRNNPRFPPRQIPVRPPSLMSTVLGGLDGIMSLIQSYVMSSARYYQFAQG